jgi:hypothetical protein
MQIHFGGESFYAKNLIWDVPIHGKSSGKAPVGDILPPILKALGGDHKVEGNNF